MASRPRADIVQPGRKIWKPALASRGRNIHDPVEDSPSLPVSTRAVWLFIILTCLTTAPFWALSIATGDNTGGRGAYSVGSMWGPGIAALLTCRLTARPVASLGWGWGETRWQVFSYLWPLAVCAVTYGLAYTLGLGGFPNPETVASLRQTLSWPNAGTSAVVSGWFALLATTGFVRGAAASLGEEIGWRGFLGPALYNRFGFTRGALLTGLTWAVWHFPLLYLSNYDHGSPWWFATPCFLIEVLSLAVIMSWVRMRSGSLWTGAIAHASINLFNQGFFAPLTAPRGAVTAYVIDESGVLLPLVLLVCAFLVWKAQFNEGWSTGTSRGAPVSARGAKHP